MLFFASIKFFHFFSFLPLLLALLDAYHLRGFFKETLLFPPHLNLENFIIIHLIHSSGPEPGGQYAETTCPMGYKARKPIRVEAKVLSEKGCLRCRVATGMAKTVQIGQ